LAVQTQDDAQYAVRARMLRPHVQHQFVGVEHRAMTDWCRCVHVPIVRRSWFVVRRSVRRPAFAVRSFDVRRLTCVVLRSGSTGEPRTRTLNAETTNAETTNAETTNAETT